MKSGKSGKSKGAVQGKAPVEESADGGKPEEKTAAASKAQEPVPQAKAVEQVVPSTETQKPEATLVSTTKSVVVAESTKPNVPSEPQKPSIQEEHGDTQESEDDENQDLQAALQASLKAPSSPQIPSGAQSSDPKGSSDLQQQESDMMTQMDTLMTELVILDSLPNPTIVQRSRARSIRNVIGNLETKLEEIESQRKLERSSKARKVQEEGAPTTKSAASSTPDQPKTPVVEKPVILKSPAPARPSSLEELIAKSMPKSGTEATQIEVISKPKAEPQQRAQPVQQPVPTKEKAVVQLKPPMMMGRALEQSSPPPRIEQPPHVVERTQEETTKSSGEIS